MICCLVRVSFRYLRVPLSASISASNPKQTMRHLGAVSDPVVLFSAVGGLAVFVCFFVHVLLCVPQHWGVPYNTRLKRHLAVSTHGFVIEILNGVFSITSCVLFVMETYDRNSNDYDFLVKSFSLETAFNG